MHDLFAPALLPRLLAVAVFLVGLTLISVGLGFALERSAFGRARRIWSVPLDPGQLRWEASANVRFHLLAVPVFTLVFGSGALRFAPSTVVSFLATYVASWVSFELYFYAMHRALHARALVRFHRLHHRSRVTTPLSGFSISLVEGLGWLVGYLAPPLVFSAIMPISLPGWMAYLVVNWTGNPLGHANLELGSKLGAGRAFSNVIHPFVYHALHHARWQGHYGLYSASLDRLLATEWSDWPSLYHRIMAQRPLESLKAKGDDAGPT